MTSPPDTLMSSSCWITNPVLVSLVDPFLMALVSRVARSRLTQSNRFVELIQLGVQVNQFSPIQFGPVRSN